LLTRWTFVQIRAGSDCESVRPTFNNCTIYNLHIYSNKRQCEEYYDNTWLKEQQRLRFERGLQHQQQEQQQQQQQQQDGYVEFGDRPSSYSNLLRRRP